jgi:hypothetical protein
MHIVLDIETEPFTKRFRKAVSVAERRRLAPKPRLACAYIVEKKKYQFFSDTAVRDVIPILEAATEVVTYNGEQFDFLVLERYCGLKRNAAFRARCVDMYEVLTQLDSRFRISLDRASKPNFCVGKKVKGKILGVAEIDTLTKGCRSDVKQTHMLYCLWREGQLLFPVRPEKGLPACCPECGRKIELVPFQPDYTDMTEGQIFDYELGHSFGVWGYVRCIKCKKFNVWGI